MIETTDNLAIGANALEFIDSLLTKEEIAESNLRVADIGESIKSGRRKGIRIRRLRQLGRVKLPVIARTEKVPIVARTEKLPTFTITRTVEVPVFTKAEKESNNYQIKKASSVLVQRKRKKGKRSGKI